MELAERLRKIMEKEFGIRTDADLIEAVQNQDGVDLGIFVVPVQKGDVLSAPV